MHSQSEDDMLGSFDMEGARGRRQSDGFRMGPGELEDCLDEDVTGLPDECDGEIPPLVSLQGRGPSQPLSMSHSQGISVSILHKTR